MCIPTGVPKVLLLFWQRRRVARRHEGTRSDGATTPSTPLESSNSSFLASIETITTPMVIHVSAFDYDPCTFIFLKYARSPAWCRIVVARSIFTLAHFIFLEYGPKSCLAVPHCGGPLEPHIYFLSPWAQGLLLNFYFEQGYLLTYLFSQTSPWDQK